MSKPIAVIISDVHYSIQTLELADAAMRQAIAKANELQVPLIVAGDLHDTKANMRAECVNAMIETFKLLWSRETIILIGNHCKTHEKSKTHALNFLSNYTKIIDEPKKYHATGAYSDLEAYYIPYQHDPTEFRRILDKIDKNSLIIMHQGIHGSKSGEYIQDKSAIPKEWLADYRVISGHYHTRQDIKCGRPQKGCVGLMSYIGNPYTLNFAEANDPDKGFQILMNDGALQFVPTNLRKHVVVEGDWGKSNSFKMSGHISPNDIVKFKATGTRENLAKLDKQVAKEWMSDLKRVPDFKLELIPLDTESKIIETSNLTQPEILDKLIDNTENVSDEQKARIKDLWKGML